MGKTYFDRYFEETNKVNGYNNFVEKGNHMFSYDFTNKDLAKIFNSFDSSDKKKIINKMTIIDFNNGDMQHFINYIMDEYVRRDVQSKMQNKETKLKEGDIFIDNIGNKYVVVKVSDDINKVNHLLNRLGKKGRLLSAMGNLIGVNDHNLNRFYKYVGHDKSLLKDFHFRGRKY
ncbi:MAG: hypothetical protein ACOCP8_09115 [archaeon]